MDLFPSSGEGRWLVLSKEPNIAGVFQFPKRCVSLYLEFRTLDKAQEPSNAEHMDSEHYSLCKSHLRLA
jgi:hypothetical protein